jgi:hypothetical protein
MGVPVYSRKLHERHFGSHAPALSNVERFFGVLP